MPNQNGTGDTVGRFWGRAEPELGPTASNGTITTSSINQEGVPNNSFNRRPLSYEDFLAVFRRQTTLRDDEEEEVFPEVLFPEQQRQGRADNPTSLREAQRLASASLAGFVPITQVNKIKPMQLNLKERHLSKSERDMLHNPASDWVDSKRGDFCKSACNLEVGDLIETLRKK